MRYLSYSSRGALFSSNKQSKQFTSQRKSSELPPCNATAADPPVIDRSKDAGHFEWRHNMILYGPDPQQPQGQPLAAPNRYRVVDHLGDGTFGRTLKCVREGDPTESQSVYAIKVIRAVQRYSENALFEAKILRDLESQGGCKRGIVRLHESFLHKTQQSSGPTSNTCLVFEPLGKSLYDFIKNNNYKGFEIGQIREIALQSLRAIEFLHSIKLTHTDLKPENILLKDDATETITDEKHFPVVSPFIRC